MLQNYQPRRNNRSFRPRGRFKRPEKAKAGGGGREFATVRLSSGISANILDFRLPQKHVLRAMPAWKPAAKPAGGGEPGVTNSATARGARPASIRERAHGSFVR